MGQGFETFKEMIQEEMERMCGRETDVIPETVTKNNGVIRSGLVFCEKGSGISAILYLEGYFKEYEKGSPLKKVAERIYRDYKSHKEESLILEKGSELERIKSYEAIKGQVFYKLVNYEKNREMLESVPHVRFCDLAVVFCLLMRNVGGGHATTLIHKEHLEMWGTDTERLMGLAEKNTPRMFPAQLTGIGEVMKEITWEYLGDEFSEEDVDRLLGLPSQKLLYVLSNRDGFHGAATVLYEGILRGFAAEIGHDLIILPSSVHEVLLVPLEDWADMAFLKEMVSQINRSEVSVEEVLSDNIYMYNRETDTVSLVYGEPKEG